MSAARGSLVVRALDLRLEPFDLTVLFSVSTRAFELFRACAAYRRSGGVLLLHSAQLQQPTEFSTGWVNLQVRLGRVVLGSQLAGCNNKAFYLLRSVTEPCMSVMRISWYRGTPDHSSRNSGNKCQLARHLTVPNFIALGQTIYETRKALQSFTPFSILAPRSRETRSAKFTNLWVMTYSKVPSIKLPNFLPF